MEVEIYHKTAAFEKIHWWFIGRRRIVEGILKNLPLPTNPKILEVGCGTGGNLSLLARYGRVFGLEMDELARRYAMNQHDRPILAGSLLQEIPFRSGVFDLIVAMDVLEHIDEDSLSVEKLFDIQKQGGYLLITVPAFAFLWSEHDKSHHHKRRYTKKPLTSIVKNAGYNIIFGSYMNTWLFPIITGVRLGKRLINLESKDDLTLPSPLINKFLSTLFASERFLMRFVSLPFGVSLLMLAKKI